MDHPESEKKHYVMHNSMRWHTVCICINPLKKNTQKKIQDERNEKILTLSQNCIAGIWKIRWTLQKVCPDWHQAYLGHSKTFIPATAATQLIQQCFQCCMVATRILILFKHKHSLNSYPTVKRKSFFFSKYNFPARKSKETPDVATSSFQFHSKRKQKSTQWMDTRFSIKIVSVLRILLLLLLPLEKIISGLSFFLLSWQLLKQKIRALSKKRQLRPVPQNEGVPVPDLLFFLS